MNRKLVVGLLILVILAAVGVTIWYLTRTPASTTPTQNASTTPQAENASAEINQAPLDIAPPSPGEQAPEGVAVPKNEVKAAPQTSELLRFYDVKIENGKFTPSIIVVKQGDVAQVNMTAVDGDYDFTLPAFGVTVPLKKGVTRKLDLSTPESGAFQFYCSLCGGPEKGPVGTLSVVPK